MTKYTEEEKQALSRKVLSQKRLIELLQYDKETGFFTRKTKSTNSYAGKVYTSTNMYGYISIKIEKKVHVGHRLAWLYVYGEWPDGPIDHINDCLSDPELAAYGKDMWLVEIKYSLPMQLWGSKNEQS